MLHDIISSITTKGLPQSAILIKAFDCLDQRILVFWLHENTCSGLIKYLAGLSVHTQDHWPATSHEFQHLRRNNRLEDRRLPDLRDDKIKRHANTCVGHLR
jgi:hypothetical protein